MVDGGVLRRGLGILVRAVREEPRIFALSVLGSAVFGTATVGGAYVVGAVTGRVVVPAFDRGETTTGALVGSAVALIALSLARVVGILGRRLGAGVMQFRLQATYRRRVTRKYLELPLAWHQRHQTGALLSNANADVEALWFPIAPFPFAVGVVVMVAIAAVTLFATDWLLALIGLAVFPAVFAVNVAYSRRMSPRMTRAQSLRSDVSALAHESFDGALVVKTLGREAAEAQRFGARATELRDALIRVGRVRGTFDPLMEALPNLGTIAVLLVGAYRVRSGVLTVSEVVTVAFLFTVLAFPLRAIGWVLGELPRSVVGWDRVRHVLDATGETRYGTTRLPRSSAPATLSVRDVTYAYPPSARDDLADAPATAGPDPGAEDTAPGADPAAVLATAPADGAVPVADPGSDGAVPVADIAVPGAAPPPGGPVLSAVTFDLPAGRTVALVGPTGSGKSTLTALVGRLVDPDEGAVTLDGVDLRDLALGEVSDAVALVPQTAFLFDDTVRGNVTLGGDARPAAADGTDPSPAGAGDEPDDDAVWAALRLAQADAFVAALPDGLDTRVGERGTSLSGGQRQRLALARALVRRPRLLVLDDATSSVDSTVEAAILRGLRTDLTTTVLLVAYRRATIALADEVVYLEYGRVGARGTHAELLATVAGYARLVTAYEEAERERVRERAFERDPEPAGVQA